MNNLEFDHADIFDDLDAIKRQFHHLVRIVPGIGRILLPAQDRHLADVLAKGCWSETEYTGSDENWNVTKLKKDGSSFQILWGGDVVGRVDWELIGDHNVRNALMAIGAARHVGVVPELACEALGHFINTKRRLEKRGEIKGVSVYDDFAHHPTAIRLTLEGLRNKVGQQRILAVLEPRSATMKMGVHQTTLAASLDAADAVFLYQPENLDWSVADVASQCRSVGFVCDDVDTLVSQIVGYARPGDQILVMSNGGFGGIHQKLLAVLEKHEYV